MNGRLPEIVVGPQVDFDEPEPVVIHKVYHDPEDALAWGVMPGAGLCGFIFTSENYVGRGESVQGDPRFIVEHCAACEDIAAQHQLEWWADQLRGN